MKIVVLNGSPRKNGNTSFFVDAFTKGAVSHEVKVFNVGNMKINGCLACEACHKGNGTCIQHDDMDEITPILNEADMVLLCSPVHYWSFSGQMQSVITRFYASGKPKKATKYGLILSSGDEGVYDSIISQYKSILSWFKAEDLGIFTFFGDNQKTEENSNKIYDFGKSI